MFPTDEDPMSETSWESIPPTTRCKINTLYPKFNFIKTHFNNAIKEYFTAIEISNFSCGNKKKNPSLNIIIEASEEKIIILLI